MTTPPTDRPAAQADHAAAIKSALVQIMRKDRGEQTKVEHANIILDRLTAIAADWDALVAQVERWRNAAWGSGPDQWDELVQSGEVVRIQREGSIDFFDARDLAAAPDRTDRDGAGEGP